MSKAEMRSTASIFGRPLHVMLVPFPIACFVGTLATDIAYWRTANIMWANTSAWLLAFGLLLGGLAALFGLIDFLASRTVRRFPQAWLHFTGNLLVLGVSLVNAFVHSRDGWTSVVPTGLFLSATAVLILIVTGWLGWSLVYRHRVGIAP